jgi:hypothetical protein
LEHLLILTRLDPFRLGSHATIVRVEISVVRQRVQTAIAAARDRARRRRSETAEAEKAYESFLQDVAIPVTKQVAMALKAEGLGFTVFTPASGLRLASDHARDDYIEFALETAFDRPHVVGRVNRTRGSRTLTDERPIKEHTPPNALTEDDILTFLVDALQPWLER